MFLELKEAQDYWFRAFLMNLLYDLRGLAVCQALLSVTSMQSNCVACILQFVYICSLAL